MPTIFSAICSVCWTDWSLHDRCPCLACPRLACPCVASRAAVGLLGRARGAGCDVLLDWPAVPLLPGARALAARGFVTGASARNWASYGDEVALSAAFAPEDQALLTDPQTSGGLLVACAPDTVTEVLSIFLQQGFERASVIGEVIEGLPRVVVG